MGKKDNQNEEKQVRTWICSVCGYEHVGVEPPKNCPVCGVEGIYFDGTVSKSVSSSGLATL